MLLDSMHSSNTYCSLFQVDYGMRNNVYTKEKMPLNEREEDLMSLEEEYNHIMEDYFVTPAVYQKNIF